MKESPKSRVLSLVVPLPLSPQWGFDCKGRSVCVGGAGKVEEQSTGDTQGFACQEKKQRRHIQLTRRRSPHFLAQSQAFRGKTSLQNEKAIFPLS